MSMLEPMYDEDLLQFILVKFERVNLRDLPSGMFAKPFRPAFAASGPLKGMEYCAPLLYQLAFTMGLWVYSPLKRILKDAKVFLLL